MKKELGVGIVGCGYWGVNYVRVFSELSGARVIAICDKEETRLKEVGQNYPEASLYQNIEEMLGSKELDAVVVSTSATTHHRIASLCLKAGKSVLIEKPVATKVSDANDLIQLSKTSGGILMVGHTFLYNSGVRKIKEYIDQASMGSIHYLYARRTNLGPIRQDVNALWDLAPHDISIFNYLLDCVPSWVSAVGAKVLGNHRDDVGFITLGYPGGIVGNIHVSWADPNKVRELVVVGSENRIVFDDINNLERVKIYEKGITSVPEEMSSFGEFHFQIRDGDIISPRIDIKEPLKEQCKHFLECVSQKTQPLTDGKSGLEVISVMRAIDQSVMNNGTPTRIEYNLTPLVKTNVNADVNEYIYAS